MPVTRIDVTNSGLSAAFYETSAPSRSIQAVVKNHSWDKCHIEALDGNRREEPSLTQNGEEHELWRGSISPPFPHFQWKPTEYQS